MAVYIQRAFPYKLSCDLSSDPRYGGISSRELLVASLKSSFEGINYTSSITPLILQIVFIVLSITTIYILNSVIKNLKDSHFHVQKLKIYRLLQQNLFTNGLQILFTLVCCVLIVIDLIEVNKTCKTLEHFKALQEDECFNNFINKGSTELATCETSQAVTIFVCTLQFAIVTIIILYNHFKLRSTQLLAHIDFSVAYAEHSKLEL